MTETRSKAGTPSKPASRKGRAVKGPNGPKSAPACPVCGGPAAVTDHLPAAHLRAEISAACEAPLPDAVVVADYDLCECRDCGLVFADPMLGGAANLYEWLATLEHRQTRARWEWREIKDRLAQHDGPAALLDVGCGTGTFLSFMADLDGLRAVGIDHSRAAIDKARERGLDAHCGDIAGLRAHIGPDARFDAITLSHVMEHVEDPKGAVTAMAGLLAPGGAIYVSIPYSPMSRERQGHDVMNLPPHHLTRWNMRSLRRFAAETGMDMNYVLAKWKSPLKRALKQTWVKKTGSAQRIPLRRKAAITLANPRLFLETYRENIDREIVDGKLAPDSILVIFRPGG